MGEAMTRERDGFDDFMRAFGYVALFGSLAILLAVLIAMFIGFMFSVA